MSQTLKTRGQRRGPRERTRDKRRLKKGNSSSFFFLRITRSPGLVLGVTAQPAGGEARAPTGDLNVWRQRPCHVTVRLVDGTGSLLFPVAVTVATGCLLTATSALCFLVPDLAQRVENVLPVSPATPPRRQGLWLPPPARGHSRDPSPSPSRPCAVLPDFELRFPSLLPVWVPLGARPTPCHPAWTRHLGIDSRGPRSRGLPDDARASPASHGRLPQTELGHPPGASGLQVLGSSAAADSPQTCANI